MKCGSKCTEGQSWDWCVLAVVNSISTKETSSNTSTLILGVNTLLVLTALTKPIEIAI